MLVDAKLMINGKELKTQIETDEAALKSIQSEEKIDRGYGERMMSFPYFYIDADGNTQTEPDMGFEEDDLRFMTANYYSSEEVAKNNARADQLMRRLRRFAVENREEEIDWNNFIELKFYIVYNYTEHILYIDSCRTTRNFGTIYFDSEEAAEDAINKFYDELIWYFTEYKDSL